MIGTVYVITKDGAIHRTVMVFPQATSAEDFKAWAWKAPHSQYGPLQFVLLDQIAALEFGPIGRPWSGGGDE